MAETRRKNEMRIYVGPNIYIEREICNCASDLNYFKSHIHCAPCGNQTIQGLSAEMRIAKEKNSPDWQLSNVIYRDK